MRFEYACIIARSADNGDPVAVFRPLIEVAVHGPRGSEVVEALVDTGADNTIFPQSVARNLGIPLRRASGPAAQAFGGQEIAMWYADVELELVHAGTSFRWPAHVYFAADEHEEKTIIVGREGFLDFFTATFLGGELALDLEPNEYLPTNPSRG